MTNRVYYGDKNTGSELMHCLKFLCAKMLFLVAFTLLLVFHNQTLAQSTKNKNVIQWGNSDTPASDPLNSSINLIVIPPQFAPIFVCQKYQDSIVAINRGSVPITLSRVYFKHTVPPIEPQFFFENGQDTVVINKLLHQNDFAIIHIFYSPTVEGTVTDAIVYEWDSGGVKKMGQDKLRGLFLSRFKRVL